jgi:hypothetical protein
VVGSARLKSERTSVSEINPPHTKASASATTIGSICEEDANHCSSRVGWCHRGINVPVKIFETPSSAPQC